MLITSEWMTTGIKMLAQIKPLFHLPEHRSKRSRRPSPNETSHQTSEAAVPVQEVDPLSIQSLLAQAEIIPTENLALGVCEDGLPLLLDLNNPAPGSLLIIADPDSGSTFLLRALLTSAILLSPAEKVALYLALEDPGEYLEISQAAHCREINGMNVSGLENTIFSLVDEIEERRADPTKGPAIVLAIDSLEACIQSLSSDAFARLVWVAKHGPRARVWTVATISTYELDQTEPHLLAAFRTRVFGKIASQRQAAYATGNTHANLSVLEAGSEFCVHFGDQLVRFHLYTD